MQDFIEKRLAGSIRAKEMLVAESGRALCAAARAVAAAFARGNKLMVCGNGGSAADAQHVAAEFVNRFMIDRPPLAAVALTCDTSVLTSIGNDFDYDQVFAKQVRALGREGDVLLAISTSGASANVLLAADAAGELGITVITLTGKDGGGLAEKADIAINVPVSATPHIQEAHLFAEHLICWLVDEILHGRFREEAR